MEIITNYLSSPCETTNGQVICVVLSSITLGLILGHLLGMRSEERKANR
jgi:hypothetical protein